MEGGCNCGAIAYAIDGVVRGIYVCHCSICRRATGAVAIPIVLARKADFRWTRGHDRLCRWSKPDADWTMNFCGTCGSNLPTENDEQNMFIPAGGLATGHERLTVTDHIYVHSKLPWDRIGDDGIQHPEAFGSG